MQQSDVILAGPAGWNDSGLTIAACRAGALGLIDLEYTTAEGGVAQVRKLDQFTTGEYGVKVGPEGEARLLALLAQRPARLRTVLLAGGDHPGLERLVGELRRQGLRVLFEAVSVAEAHRGADLQVDGLVLKGQEAGGRVGTEPLFILLQRWLAQGNSSIPVYAQGGIGIHTAAACVAAGVRGVVLDTQLLLLRESPLSHEQRQRVAALDGSETTLVGERLAAPYRMHARPGLPALVELQAEEERIATAELTPAERQQAWRETIYRLARQGPERGPWLMGQDVALAAPLAAQGGTVGGLLDHLRAQVDQHLAVVRRMQPLAEGAPLAQQHRTRYPILQGPMTRVSDVAPFAEAVAAGGGLPFLALALLRGPECETLLEETKARLGERSWGVGLLGFMPLEIRTEQLAAIRKHRPPFAIIAGGRPDQARELEAEGIVTYLHVPSPGLLRMFLKEGARRFIFEGRECGGHVGPRTSFVLWESMIEELLEHLGKAKDASDLSIVFAGGIHDARSAAMTAALAAPLVERKASIGVLMGTAYLFTQEIVSSGAVVERFQQEALTCAETTLLQTAPGHAIRCVPTPYCADFEQERQRLIASGRSHEEVARSLEMMNLGRLRLASKGVDRSTSGSGRQLETRPPEEQFTRGMYMIGQVACLRDRVVSVAELHEEVSRGGTAFLDGAELQLLGSVAEEPARPPCDVAIVGMSAFYPGAKNTLEFWHNILDRHYAVGEVPASHWDWRLYYDPDPRARDRIISKWGGFLTDMPFNPLDYGITPKSLESIEPLQLFLLEAARLAFSDAGYDWKDEGARRGYEPGVMKRSFPRERTAAILGIGGGGSPLAVQYGFRTCLPLLNTVPGLNIDGDSVLERSREVLPEWTEDSFPGILFNVAVGRVANRLNLGGPNYAIDAACGSSLAAVYACVRELELGTSDLAIAMGADTVQTPYAYMAFSKTHALSPRGRCRPFDAEADGIVLSEGVGAVILKRLADAERDGDPIYAVIKGMGASSDGRDKGLTAPRAEGQLRALRRAYAQAGISPAAVELIEAHGTGTVVGDQTEARALAQVLEEAGAPVQSCAVGSVKSMIGHTKCAAGIAGLIKAALALHRRTLPPTLVETPNKQGNFEQGPLYLNTEARPWVRSRGPRYAGVSAFGFGGTNFHAVLAEYEGAYESEAAGQGRWPAELFVWSATDGSALAQQLGQVEATLAGGAQPALAELAAASWKAAARKPGHATTTIVAGSLAELRERLALVREQAAAGVKEFSDPRGAYYTAQLPQTAEPIAFLFPGQGSQYPNMLAQTALAFPVVRQALDQVNTQLAESYDRPLARWIYPGSAFSPAREREQREALARTDVAQPAIGACSVGLLRLLQQCGVEPAFTAGHSYGEFVALTAAGALDESDLPRLSYQRGAVIRSHEMPGGMVALDTDEASARGLLDGLEGVYLANCNAPAQTVVAGSETGLEQLLVRCGEKGVRGQRLPVACAFHSPLVAAARAPLAQAIAGCRLTAPRLPVFSNVTASAYPADPTAIAAQLSEHLVSPVRFRDQVEAMYTAGARLFVEVGPHAVLTGLVRQILGDRPHLATASDVKGRPGVAQLLHLLGQLVVRGVAVRPAPLFEARGVRPRDLAALAAPTKYPPTTWMVNSVRSRPVDGPEPYLLGQSRPQTAATTTTPPAAPVAPALPRTSPGQPSGVSRMVPLGPGQTATNGNGHHSPDSNGKAATAAPPSGEAAQVVLGFQNLMARFLDTQKSVMMAYLQGKPGGVAAPEALAAPPVVVARPTPAPAPAPAPGVAPVAVPVVEKPQAPAPAAPPGKVQPDRAWITDRLLDLIGKRTGYPREMLGLDIDLEADLGIDSIKRVEILAEMAQALGATEESGMPGGLEMEKLTAIGTLRGIIDYLDGALNKPASTKKSGAAAPPKKPAPPADEPRIQRAVVGLVDCPLLGTGTSLLGPGVVVVTDDGTGVARELASRLADLGRPIAILRHGAAAASTEGVYAGDLASEAGVRALLERVRNEVGPISGVVHLLPLEASGPEPWDSRARRDTRSLYLLARQLEEELRGAGKQGHAFFLTATRLGGTFGFGEQVLPADYSAGQGGVLGFVKCLGQEWPEVTVRAVDVDPAEHTAGDLADRLLAEASAVEGPFEVGFRRGKRMTWAPRPVVLEKKADVAPLLEPGQPVLITGGARGITAAVALELARRYRPTLLLVGRSPLPAEVEDPATAGLTTPAEIKSALIARQEREGRPPAPALIEAAFQKLMHEREIRSNLQRLREAGAGVHYAAVDVRDEAAFGELLTRWQEKFGPFAGVIHGAGVIEDRLIRAKTPESFDRVFDTKVVSARILVERLRQERLRFCVFFASLASRYGNKGQADYAAANEVLSKLALQLDRSWPGRVVSVAWGPWAQIGMVAELEKHLVGRGLRLISPEEGPMLLLDELMHGSRGDREVVFAGGAEAIVHPGKREARPARES